MFGLDDWIANLGAGGTIAAALGVALLVGLRHATDPDHLTAVSSLVISGRGEVRQAARLGFSWGAGHAVTLLAFGLPAVLVRRHLPEAVVTGAELAVGVLIAWLGGRLLYRWRRGYFHLHRHSHGEAHHSHPHVHVTTPAEHGEHGEHGEPIPDHRHAHAESLGRTARGAFAIGLVHGLGGSAGAAILLVAAIPSGAVASVSLAVFALGTAASMALASTGFGWLASRGPSRRLDRIAPIFGAAAVCFGVWYSLGAIQIAPYPF